MDVLFIFMRVGISLKKEKVGNYLADLHERCKHFGDGCFGALMQVGGKHICVDLIGVSPLV
jgi:hypothetical protein